MRKLAVALLAFIIAVPTVEPETDPADFLSAHRPSAGLGDDTNLGGEGSGPGGDGGAASGD